MTSNDHHGGASAACCGCARARCLRRLGPRDRPADCASEDRAGPAASSRAACASTASTCPTPSPTPSGPGLVRVGEGVSPQVMRRADEACREVHRGDGAEAVARASRPSCATRRSSSPAACAQHGDRHARPAGQRRRGSGSRSAARAQGARINPESPSFRDGAGGLQGVHSRSCARSSRSEVARGSQRASAVARRRRRRRRSRIDGSTNDNTARGADRARPGSYGDGPAAQPRRHAARRRHAGLQRRAPERERARGDVHVAAARRGGHRRPGEHALARGQRVRSC